MHAYQTHLATRTVYVVAWRSATATGFDWYRTASAANDAFIGEKANCLEVSPAPWEAFRFDVKVPLRLSDASITDLIDVDLDNFLGSAPIRFDSAQVFPPMLVPMQSSSRALCGQAGARGWP